MRGTVYYMKRFAGLILAAAMLCGLCSCGGTPADPDKAQESIQVIAMDTVMIFSVYGEKSTHAAYAAEDEDPVLFTFNGQEYHQSEVVRNASAYGQAQLISSETAYEEAIEYMITNQLVAEAKAAELGLDQYTDEELAEIKAEAD